MTKQLHIIVVPHTHWDREWYQTFQQFRVRLVHTIDKLLDILDLDEKFSHFMLDGQTIVLDDYLEVRPEQEEHLKRYTRAGRILVGPWYAQPDEFLPSGEALIRNLQCGIQRATEFGSLMRVGYLPDCFGHIAQMPQILQGCGIDNAVFWRGVGSEAHKSEFSWAAPDGTSVLAVHLADPIGYSNARQLPLNPEEFVTRVELLSSNILAKATTDTLLFMNGSDHLEPQDGLPEVIEAANTLLARLDPQHEKILLDYARANGDSRHFDSISLQIGTLPHYIERIRQHDLSLQTLHGEMRSSQYAHLLPSVLSTRMWIKQQNAATEHLLERWVEPLTAWAARLGAAYPHGFVRMAWKYLLQNQPHDSICGCSIDEVHRENGIRFAQSQQISQSLITQSLQYIAQQLDTRAPFDVQDTSNEPIAIVVFNPAPGPRTASVKAVIQLPGSLHNAMIVDEQGKQMPYRVTHRWRQEIGSLPLARETLAAAVALSGITTPEQLIQMAHSMIMSSQGLADDSHVISRLYIEDYIESPLHHTHHIPQPGVIHIEIMIAPQGRVTVNQQELHTAGEHVLSFLKREDISLLEVTLVDQARETIDFNATDLPGYGFKTFWFYPRGLPEAMIHAQAESRFYVPPTTLSVGPNKIENEFYVVEVNTLDGTLEVTDKQTGGVFTGLNRFVDGGDVGDLYTYCPPEKDVLVREPLEPPKIEIINMEPLRVMVRVSSRWAFPSACTASRTERSARSTVCSIVSEISLIPGVQRVDIHTRLDNKVKDHRLRVLFPVPYPIEHAASEGTFEVRMRSVSPLPPAESAEWVEEPVNTFPQKRFVDVSDGQVGLAVLNRGLPECEIVRSDSQQAVALTLLRCVEWLSRGDLATRRGHAGPMEHTPEAQCLGQAEFDYALVLHQGTWESTEALVLREAQAFTTPLDQHTLVTGLHAGRLASHCRFLTVEPSELVVSAIKQQSNGQGVVVRVYNPLSRTVTADISPGFAFEHAYVANLLEEPVEPLETEETAIENTIPSVQVTLRGGEILTLAFL